MTDKNKALLDKIRMPGATFRLPSEARFYKDGEVDLENGKPEVYVSPLTTMDELALVSTDKLLNGTAIDEVFSRCIPAIKKPRQMLARDVDYLVIALRVVSLGAGVDITAKHTCPDAKAHIYDLDAEQHLLDPTKRIAPEDASRYEIDLSNGIHISLRPMTYGDLLAVQEVLDSINKLHQQLNGTTKASERQALADKIKEETHRYYVVRSLAMINHIDEVTDRETLETVLTRLPLPLRTEFIQAQDSVDVWGPPTTVTLKCKDCGEEMEVDLDLNPVGFFTQRSRNATQT